MNRKTAGIGLRLAVMLIGIALLGSGCTRPEQGPVLAGGREVNSWVKALNDPRPKVRREAVLKLGNVGDTDPSVADALARALGDADSQVRHDAVLAVVKLSHPGTTIRAKLELMSQSDKDRRVRDVARRALAHMGNLE